MFGRVIGALARLGVLKMDKPQDGPSGIMGGIQRSTSDPPARGTREHLEVFEAAPWPRAVGDKVATAVACSNFRLMARQRAGKAVRDQRLQKAPMDVRIRLMESMRADLQEITEHPFLSAMDNPNPFMDRMGLLKITELHLDFVGDAFWLKDRNGLGAPMGFWPIPPHWVAETPRPENPTFRFQWKSWNATVPASEVQWFSESKPVDPYTRGTGIGWSLGDEIQVDEYAAKMASAFFFNRARPDFVFATGMDPDETKRLEMEWTSRNQGWWRWHRPYFLAGAGELPNLQTQIREFQQPTMEQLVYPGLRKVQRDIILQVWGVSPEMFGIVENSNRATIEAAEYLFTKWVVAPKSERIRAGLQRLFIEDYDERGIVHCDSPVTEDKVHLLNAMKAAPWVSSLDEWRAVAGMAPLGGELGKARMVPLNSYLAVDPLDAASRPAAAGSAQRATDTPEESPEEQARRAFEQIGAAQ